MTTYVLQNGEQYKVVIKNNGRACVQGVLSIDGKDVGTWHFLPGVDYEAIERPSDIAKKFVFYTIRAVRAAEIAVAAATEKIQSAEPATAGEQP